MGSAAAVAASALDTPPRAEVARTNSPINAGARDPFDIRAQNSPMVAENPKNARNLAVANRIDSPTFSCALHISLDGGASWSDTRVPMPRGEEPKCFAPDAVFGSDGTLYFLFVTLRGVGNTAHAVWISTSNDGGRTLSAPMKVLGPLAFQVHLLVDERDPRRLHLTWLQASTTGNLSLPTTGNPILYKTSRDGGRTWSRPVRVSHPARERVVAPSPAADSAGNLYVLYLDLRDDRLDYAGAHGGNGGPPYPGSWQLVLARSNGEGGWRETVVEDDLVPTTRFIVFLPPLPSIALGDDGRVYAAFTDGRLGDADVYVWASRDEGATFQDPIRVNDTKRRDGTSQYLPKLALAPNGRVDVLYYDRRHDPKNVKNEVSLQSSHDEGASFEKRATVSNRAFSSQIGLGSERGLPDLGSRLGLLSGDDRDIAVWTDTSAGTVASNKQNVLGATIRFKPTAPLPEPALDAIRYAGYLLVLLGVAVLATGALRRRRGGTAR